MLFDNINSVNPVCKNASLSIISPWNETSFNFELYENADFLITRTVSGSITFSIDVSENANSPISFNIDPFSKLIIFMKWQCSNK